MEKLQLKHLAPYLPYSLKVIMEGKKTNVAWISAKNIAIIRPDGIGEYKKIAWKYAQLNIKPILRPLYDLPNQKDCENELWEQCKDIDENLDYIREFDDDLFKTSLSYRAVSILIMWKFDVFGLIKKGLAKNILELKEEPLNEVKM